jgi:CheY-like chemotaxis protein
VAIAPFWDAWVLDLRTLAAAAGLAMASVTAMRLSRTRRALRELTDEARHNASGRGRAEAALHELLGKLRAELDTRAADAVLADPAHAESARTESGARVGEPFCLIGLLRPDGTVLEVNRPALAFGALQPNDVLQRPLWQAGWWGGDLDRVARLRSAVAHAAEGEVMRLELDVAQTAAAAAIRVALSLKPVRMCGMAAEIRLLLVEAQEVDRPQTHPAIPSSGAEAATRRLSDILHAADPAPATGSPQPAPAPAPATPPAPPGVKRLLLVDDSALLRGLLAAELEQHGYSVLQADDAPAALALLRREPVDLLISDLAMPGPSGLELTRDARALWPAMPMLLLTGHASHEAALVSDDTGRGPFMLMRKPPAERQLATQVASMIGDRHAWGW